MVLDEIIRIEQEQGGEVYSASIFTFLQEPHAREAWRALASTLEVLPRVTEIPFLLEMSRDRETAHFILLFAYSLSLAPQIESAIAARTSSTALPLARAVAIDRGRFYLSQYFMQAVEPLDLLVFPST